MSDENGFDFRRPGERREPKRFEPPPWERDAFEEIGQRKAEPEAGAERAPVGAPPAAVKPEVSAPRITVAPSRGEGVDEATLIELLAGLAAEEPPAKRTFFGVAMGSALLLVALGSVLLIWAIAALMSAGRTGLTGTYAGAGLGLFGVGFIAGGVWLGYQALKRRGVL